jgi:hypothetical protein
LVATSVFPREAEPWIRGGETFCGAAETRAADPPAKIAKAKRLREAAKRAAGRIGVRSRSYSSHRR